MTFIVAELGANWKGDTYTLENMLIRCKSAGIDAVKFQALSKDLVERHPEWDWYDNAHITADNIDSINNLCNEIGIDWFCTPCYPEIVKLIEPYVSEWKIRRADNQRVDIISECMLTGKPVYVSVSRPNDTLKLFKKDNLFIDNIKEIYCIPKYPTSWGEINFDMVSQLHGYSNHCLDPLALLKAVRYGADYLEFHLTDNRDDFAIDNKVSFSYSQMEEMVAWIRKFDDSINS